MNHNLGHIFENQDVLVFFGNRSSSLEALVETFPFLNFQKLKQIHSDIVVETTPLGNGPLAEADAHYTSHAQLALCVFTADCIPVLIYDPIKPLAAAIHAGWRGVANEIVLKSCRQLMENGSRMDRAKAWVGPHIGRRQFEVGLDVAQNLDDVYARVRSNESPLTSISQHSDEGKKFVDLKLIATHQIKSAGVPSENIEINDIDTYTSPHHHSYRRDGRQAGRQLSFISMKK